MTLARGGEGTGRAVQPSAARFSLLRRVAGRGGLRLVPIACLYMSYGATLGLLGTGAPLVLRAAGVPLGAVGFVQIIYLPIGLGFVWAPLLDRLRPPSLPHRTGWVVAAQLATAALLTALSFGGAWPLAALGALALGVSVAAATTDLSLDALVVETVPEAERAAVTTAKLVGSSLGTAAGIGLATLMSDPLDLSRALRLLAAASLVLALPIFAYPERSRGPMTRANARQGTALPERRARRLLLSRAARLGGYFAALLALGAAPGYLLIDLHLPLRTVGFVTGPLGTAVGALATLASGALLARSGVGASRLVLVCAGGVAASCLALFVAALGGLGWLGVAGTLGTMLCSSGLGVPVFATLYRWSEGARAATDYAVLFGAAFLVSFPARVATPALAAAVGWPGFFALVAPLFLAATASLTAAFAGTPEAEA